MGKAGRVACITTPLLFTLAALVCLILIGLGGTRQSDSNLTSIYFFRADTSAVHAAPSAAPTLPEKAGTALNSNLVNALLALKHNTSSTVALKDFYTVSLWNYCSGTKNGSGSAANQSTVDFCSTPVSHYWFDPVTVWGLNDTGVANLFPTTLAAGLKSYHTVSQWMYIMYIAAGVTTSLELLAGFLTVFSRWGSAATTILASIAASLTLLASITATALYGTLAATFDTALRPYGIHGSLGHNAFVITWLAVAFSSSAAFFWLLSTCCCSGRSEKIRGSPSRRSRARHSHSDGEKGYARVGSPYIGHTEPQGVPMHNMATPAHHAGSYEPYRHV